MYFRFAKKLISPEVASASDAALVICSDASPKSSPPDAVASCSRVKIIGKTVRESGFGIQIIMVGTGRRPCASARPGGRALPARNDFALLAFGAVLPAGRTLFDEGL